MAIVKSMKLSELDTAALRLAISRNDSSIRSALDLFRRSLDENALIAQLRACAKQTIDSTLDQAGYALEEEDEERESRTGRRQWR